MNIIDVHTHFFPKYMKVNRTDKIISLKQTIYYNYETDELPAFISETNSNEFSC